MSKDFGRFLSELRRASKITQVDLANQAGVKNSLISHLEAGRVGTTFNTASNIAEALNIPPEMKSKFYLLAFGCPEAEVDSLLLTLAKDSSAIQAITEIKSVLNRH